MKQKHLLIFALAALLCTWTGSVQAEEPGESCISAIALGKEYSETVTESKTVWYTAWTFDLPLSVYFIPDHRDDPAPEVVLDFSCTGEYKDKNLCNLFCPPDGTFADKIPYHAHLAETVIEGKFMYYISIGKTYRDLLIRMGIDYNVQVFISVTYHGGGFLSIAPDDMFSNCMDGAAFMHNGEELKVQAKDDSTYWIAPYIQWQDDSIRYIWRGEKQCQIAIATKCDFDPLDNEIEEMIQFKKLQPGDTLVVPKEKLVSYVDSDEKPSEAGMFFAKFYSQSGGIMKVERIRTIEVPFDEATGFYSVPAGDAPSLLAAIAAANATGDAKIFLPNGTYNLGAAPLTTICANNISLIGESAEGVIIQNAPLALPDALHNTATLRIAENVQGTYLQDLTIRNALTTTSAVALWDQGTQTVCKNVRLLSRQNTYFSNLTGAVKFFEDCEIHGALDLISGDGSVYFRNSLLRADQSADDAIAVLSANNGAETDNGFVFDACTVQSENPVLSLGRAWANTPTALFLNTTVDYSAGQFAFADEQGTVQRWTKSLLSAGAWPRFGEFNTRLEDEQLITPESNLVTFVDPFSDNATQELETVISEEQAAAFTIGFTLGEWAATAEEEVLQVELRCDDGEWSGAPEGTAFLIKKDGVLSIAAELPEWKGEEGLIVRAANKRGGFGAPAVYISHEGIDQITNDQLPMTNKVFINGVLYIERNNHLYDAAGRRVD
ncbi:MAG: hypothetical protein IJP76_02540 [Paludibacteraceae bacterium]|nr:hypothetical protein [Paludibacteraceae bacterium]